jgi:hypothetical protein
MSIRGTSTNRQVLGEWWVGFHHSALGYDRLDMPEDHYKHGWSGKDAKCVATGHVGRASAPTPCLTLLYRLHF